ncbi:GCN5-like N-acetyltransferase [Angomonas deanei]|uniref:Acetyltransferase (GNAT) family, putative n=1 Tax=Angomonas deanei TaxID=59799 RepID=A0A7G2CD84_9TRYP|nr:GCN5-like N-acetyltransferase [Angomonas deanei]CAD2216092.1 Acetyltransferase (GNAT) family, putative [Angomonas deanei]|eukprot:EPY19226.1 GCN5-like N-acetyltransferase [Angomonas deanei]
MFTILPLTEEHVADVVVIQKKCYTENFLEEKESYLAKIKSNPDSCFIALAPDGDSAPIPAGYLCSLRTREHCMPSLNSAEDLTQLESSEEVTTTASKIRNTLYIHDVAVHPRYRGKGLVELFFERLFAFVHQHNEESGAEEQIHHLSLIAVQGAAGYWEKKFHFRRVAPESLPSALKETLYSSYGADAAYMERDL